MRRVPLKSALFFLALSLCAGAARAQYPFVPIVQSQSAASNGTPVTCPYQSNVTMGNIGFLLLTWESSTNTPVVTDTLLSTWTQVFLNTSTTLKMAVFTTTFASSGTNTISAAIVGASFLTNTCVEAPPDWTTTVDASAFSNWTGQPGTITAPAITTTLNSDLIFNFTGNNNSAGFQLLQNASLLVPWYMIGSIGGNDSSVTAFRVGGAAGATGNNVTFDNFGNTGSIVSIAFKSKAIAVTNAAAAPDGDTTHSYSYTLLAAGGVGAYTWSVTGGALPGGLSLNASTGAITGTPTVSNNYSATFQVTDGTNTATKAITFKITTGLQSIAFVQGASVTAGVSGVHSITLTGVSFGDALLINAGYGMGGSQFQLCQDSFGTSFATIQLWGIHSVNSFATLGNMQILAGQSNGSGTDIISCGATSGITPIMGVGEFTNANFYANDNGLPTRGSNASPATITSGSFTPLVPNELLFGGCSGQTAATGNTINSPFTVIGNNGVAGATGYDLATTVTTYTMACAQTGNTDQDWIIGIAGIRPSGGTVSPPSGRGPKGKIL